MTTTPQIQSFIKEKTSERLEGRQKEVMTALQEYHAIHEHWPTSKELFTYMVETRPGISAMDYSSYQPRLTTELKNKNLVEETGSRPCKITGKKATTWKEVGE